MRDAQHLHEKISSKKIILTSLLVDVSDVILNVAVAVFSGSVVMFAQALQGAADLSTSGFLYLGFKRSLHKADRRHSFGYGREAYFWTLMSGIAMLTVSAGLSFYLGWRRFQNPQPIENLAAAFVVLTIGMITNMYALSLSIKRLHHQRPWQPVWKSFVFSDLIQIKTTLVLDLVGSAAAVLGIVALAIFAATGNLHFDGLGAMLIGATTAVFAIFLMLEVKDFLVGRSASQAVEQKIKEAALEVDEVKKVLDLHTMYIGPTQLLVNMDIHVQDKLVTDQIEQLVTKIKSVVRRKVPMVEHLQIELEAPHSK